MSKAELFSMVRNTTNKHSELLVVLFRIFANTMILLLSMTLSCRYFGDTLMANIGVFMLLSASVELVMSCSPARKEDVAMQQLCLESVETSSRLSKMRYYSFVACICGMLISGSLVLHGSCNAQKAVASGAACHSPPTVQR